MQFNERLFQWRNSVVAYHVYGKGQKLMIAFHGFDQDSRVFEAFKPSFENEYMVVSVDLPHQGATQWKEEALSTAVMQCLVTDFLLHLNHQGTVALMAYSLGGNYALGFLVSAPEIVDEIWLIAADGLKNKPIFNFLTKTSFGNLLFQRFVKSASIIKFVIRMAKIIRFIPKHVGDFYLVNIETEPKRAALYARWLSSSRIVPNQKDVYASINNNGITCRLLFGEFDQVIPVANAVQFKKYVPSAQLVIVPQGHNLLKSKNNAVIQQMLSEKPHPLQRK